MSKFVITCPACGRYAEARTGFFARKKIDCACGHTIDVRTEKMTTRVCTHCGNPVMYDQSKGGKAVCPVCGEPIAVSADQAEFACEQCGVRLVAARGASTYTCPVCDFENDVAERLAKEQVRKQGLASVIKYEGSNDTLIWKHPIEDFNYGSQLIVHESQEAIFFRDGQALDLFGPGRYTLETEKIPILERVYHLPTDPDATFHSEVYFINKAVQMAIKWGTPDKVRFIDPLTGVPLELGASGEMNLQVSDSRKLLIKLVGTMKGIAWEDGPGFTKSLQASFRPLIVSAVKTNLAAVIRDEAIDLLEIDQHLDTISANLREKIVAGLEEYGLTAPEFYVTSVVLPENDPNFKRIRDLHTITLQTRMFQAEATVKTAQAQSETMYRTAQEQSKAAIEAAARQAELERQATQTAVARQEAERELIRAQAEAQAKQMSGMAEAAVMQAKGYSQKDVIQADVQKAYAEGIGNMGPAISAGGASGGTGMVGELLTMGIGLSAMNAMAPQVGNMMQGVMGSLQPNVAPVSGGWDCTCGQKNIASNFCPNCGAKKPEPKTGWDCTCGQKNIASNFCPNCGARKPEPKTGWDCACGEKNILSNFCPSCGSRRPAETWACPDCGTADIRTAFCPNCGRKREG